MCMNNVQMSIYIHTQSTWSIKANSDETEISPRVDHRPPLIIGATVSIDGVRLPPAHVPTCLQIQFVLRFAASHFSRRNGAKQLPPAFQKRFATLILRALSGKNSEKEGKRECSAGLQGLLKVCRKRWWQNDRANHRRAEAISRLMALALMDTQLLSLCYQL